MNIVFVDTSILCNVLPVPGRDQHRETVMEEMREHLRARTILILPSATVIETGNHVAQIPDGRVRRDTAQQFANLLSLVQHGKAPWIPHEFEWDQDFVGRMVAGARLALIWSNWQPKALAVVICRFLWNAMSIESEQCNVMSAFGRWMRACAHTLELTPWCLRRQAGARSPLS